MMETLCSDSSAGSPGGSALRRVHRDGTLRVYRAQQYSTLKGKLEAYRGGLSRSRLNRVQEYINANLSDKLELRVLAEVAGVNLYHFARAFKQSTDESPHQYVLRRRIELAKELLRHPQMSIIEASARTGFC
jgi:AraC family transcriptional regulator